MAALRVVTWNTRLDHVVIDGDVPWLLAHARPDLILIQEGRDPERLRRELGPSWNVSPASKSRAGTYVAWRTDRFTLRRAEDPDVTFGEQYPRHRTLVVLHDRLTGHTLTAASVHVAPLGNGFAKANAAARTRHERQVQSYANRLAEVPVGRIVLAGGDWNERLSARSTYPAKLRARDAVARMASAGLTFTHRELDEHAGLDDLAFRADEALTLKSRDEFSTPSPRGDHPAVLVTFELAPRPKD